VYRFRDHRGRVLYLGRAASLRSRVASYWGSLGDRAHLASMVPCIATIEAVECDSEHEAAWLERNLLERQLPPWNRTRGGQEVPVYIRLDDRPGTAGLRVVHAAAPGDAARYFGPYLGGLKARLAVSALHRVLPLAHTAEGLTGAARDLARALGIEPADRAALAGAVTAVLDRDAAAVASLRAELTRRRDLAASRLGYETAARRQAELEAVGWIVAEQKMVLTAPAGFDVCGWAGGVLVCFGVRDGRLCSWTRRRCTEVGARSRLAATPPGWREFSHRAAELAARLTAAQPAETD
jgi:excinuclease ABC subunit C